MKDRYVQRARKIQKLSTQLRKIQFPKDKSNIECIRCKKKLVGKNDCFDCLFGTLTFSSYDDISLRATGNNHFMLSTFPDDIPSLFCKKCNEYLMRAIGFVPEISDEDHFPQQGRRYSIADLENKTNPGKKIYYKKKTYPFGRKKYDTLLKLACRQYVKKYPEFTFSSSQLFKKIKRDSSLLNFTASKRKRINLRKFKGGNKK